MPGDVRSRLAEVAALRAKIATDLHTPVVDDDSAALHPGDLEPSVAAAPRAAADSRGVSSATTGDRDGVVSDYMRLDAGTKPAIPSGMKNAKMVASKTYAEIVAERHTRIRLQLAAAYRDNITALVAAWPGQAQNIPAHDRELASSKLGRVVRALETKGRYSEFAAGEWVLVFAEGRDGDVAIWGVASDCPTIINPCDVEVIA